MCMSYCVETKSLKNGIYSRNVLKNEVLALERCLKILLIKLSFLLFCCFVLLGKRKNLKKRRKKKKTKQMAKKPMKVHHRIIQWQGMIEVNNIVSSEENLIL